LARFFCEDVRLGRIALDSTEAHHLMHVLRLRAGEAVEVMDGRGAVGTGIVAEIGRKSVVVDVRRVEQAQRRQNGRLIIIASIPKGVHLDALVTQCTELAADHIVLTVFERTVKQPAGQNFVERCRKLTIAAAKQCGRPFLPVLSGPETLTGALSELADQYPAAKIVFGRCDKTTQSIADVQIGGTDVIAVVGPEGGMTEEEEKFLEQHKAVGVRLGENILRVETAAMAFCAICAAHR